MDHIAVKSSNIDSVGFSNGVMEIKFKNGGTYQYTGVTKDSFNELVNAKSVGKHLNSMGLKGHKIR